MRVHMVMNVGCREERRGAMIRWSSVVKNQCFLCSIIFCLAIYSASNFFVFFRSRLPSSLCTINPQLALPNSSPNPPPPLLKVFLYDLPRKFTFGVIEEYLRARSILHNSTFNDSRFLYPGNQHSAEWWLFLDLTKPPSQRLGSPALRVPRPMDADVFYVPFFSSLSVKVNPFGSDPNATRTNYSDVEMQIELVNWLEKQEPWLKNRGRDHVIVCQDPNALHAVIDRLKSSILLLSDFGRLDPGQGSWWKDVVLPYSHRVSTYVKENATLQRTTLLFFMGNRYRKQAENGLCSPC